MSNINIGVKLHVIERETKENERKINEKKHHKGGWKEKRREIEADKEMSDC